MRLGRSLAWIATGVALALVFAAYLRPDLAVTLANQLWACF
jgi:multisubunit Na+/H+ antiporter MnhB subunit